MGDPFAKFAFQGARKRSIPAPSEAPKTKKKKIYLKDANDRAEIICKQCRSAPSEQHNMKQAGLDAFFPPKKPVVDSESVMMIEYKELGSPTGRDDSGLEATTIEAMAAGESGEKAPVEETDGVPALHCSRCRRPMQEKTPTGSTKANVCPFILRLRGYQKAISSSPHTH